MSTPLSSPRPWWSSNRTRKELKKNGKYVLLAEDETFENLADDDNAIPEDIVISKEKQEKVREVINTELTEDEKTGEHIKEITKSIK